MAPGRSCAIFARRGASRASSMGWLQWTRDWSQSRCWNPLGAANQGSMAEYLDRKSVAPYSDEQLKSQYTRSNLEACDPRRSYLSTLQPRRNLRSPQLSTRRTSKVWRCSRQPNGTELKATKHYQRIWFCKTQDGRWHTHNFGNPESSLPRE